MLQLAVGCFNVTTLWTWYCTEGLYMIGGILWQTCSVIIMLATDCTDEWWNKKAELPQRWPRDAPYIWVPWKFSRVTEYTPTATFAEIFNGLLFRSILLICVGLYKLQNVKFVALPIPEIIGGTNYAHATFSPKFVVGFCSDGPCEYLPNLKFVALPVPEIIAIAVLG